MVSSYSRLTAVTGGSAAVPEKPGRIPALQAGSLRHEAGWD